jgi:putative CocE/NonD family hydrolase
MQDFIALRKAGCESRITIGPWRHTDAELMQAGMHDAIDWFARHLPKDGRKEDTSKSQPVKLYVVGANEWRYFDEWPPRESVIEPWYLQPQRKLLDRVASESQADSYRYDPAAPTPSVGGPSLESEPFAVDNTTLEERSDVLTYTSEPLPQPRDIIGPVTAELYVSSNAASADFFVRLCDVDVKGVSRNICDGLQRVQIAASVDKSLTPQRVQVELWPTAYRLAPGHRLRVQISSGAFPRWARNPGSIEPIARATELRSATQSIHHSPTCPSAVMLPFVPNGALPVSHA